jgi:hypothetical protein
MPKPPVIAVGSPCARMVRAQFFIDRDSWLSDNRFFIPTPKLGAQAGRIDVARSDIFDWAKKLSPSAHVQVDTDIQFLQPLYEMMQIVFEDFEMGYDIIIGPTVAYNARAMTWGFKEKPHSYGPNPIVHGAFGWVAFSPRILRGLKPIDSMTNANHEKLNLYCMNGNLGEDNTFCDTATSQGFKVGCDFRLHVGHVKETVLAPCLPDQAEDVKRRYGSAAQFVIQDIQLPTEEARPLPPSPL